MIWEFMDLLSEMATGTRLEGWPRKLHHHSQNRDQPYRFINIDTTIELKERLELFSVKGI